MISKATKIRLGIFLFFGMVLIIIFVAAVAGNSLRRKWDTYYISFEDYPVSGLQVGGNVNYQGIKVGRVEGIKLDPKNVNKVVVTINIEPGTPIKEDSEAVLSLVGITGLKAVEIRGGTNEARTIKPGSFIKAGSTMIDDISERAISIVDKIDLIAANIHDLTNEENRENIAKILEQTELILEETHSNLAGTLDAVSRISNNLADLTDDVANNLDDITVAAVRAVDSLSTISTTSIDEVTKNINQELLLISENINSSLDEIAEQVVYLLQDGRFYVNNIGENTNNLVLDTSKDIAQISANINSSLERIDKILASAGFESLMLNIGELSGQLAEADIKQMVSNLSVTIQRTGVLVNTLNRAVLRSQDDLVETLENLRDTSGNLNEFSRQISDNPAILIRGN